MRRGLAFLSVAFVLVGIELSTEAVSLALVRLRSGILAVLFGVEFYLPKMRFGAGLLALFLGALLWGLLGWSGRTRRVLASQSRSCPECAGPTRRVKRSELQRLMGVLMGEKVTSQRCDGCGWSGLSLYQ